MDGNAIILHDAVVHTLVWLFRSTLGLSVSVEPLGLFSQINPDNNRRPDILLQGEAKSSKVRSVMKWWSKCISMAIAIAKTTSRNMAFKVARLRESIMEGQNELIILILYTSRKSSSDSDEEVGLEETIIRLFVLVFFSYYFR